MAASFCNSSTLVEGRGNDLPAGIRPDNAVNACSNPSFVSYTIPVPGVIMNSPLPVSNEAGYGISEGLVVVCACTCTANTTMQVYINLGKCVLLIVFIRLIFNALSTG